MFNPFKPEPAPAAFGQHTVVPELKSSPLSRLLFSWLTPFLWVGYTRPLQVEDLWQIGEFNRSRRTADAIEEDFARQTKRIEEKRLKAWSNGTPDSETVSDTVATNSTDGRDEKEKQPTHDLDPEKVVDSVKKPSKKDAAKSKEKKKTKNPSVFRALHTIFFNRIWTAGALKFTADTLQTTTPLVNKALLNWLTDVYYYYKAGPEAALALGIAKPRSIGYGFGLGAAVFVMQELASLLTNHYMMLTMTTGLTIRAGVVSIIFRKALRLSPKARIDHSVGQITTMISTDAARLDFSSYLAHQLWISPVQITIGIGLLIGNLGVSALVGLAVLIISFPFQAFLVTIFFKQRKKGVKFTDKRVRLSTEVLQGIRLLKFYAWEAFYAEKISELRSRELRTIRITAFARSTMISIVTVVPIAASVLSFITYALTGHNLSPGVIFSSLQLFNIIKMPMAFLPLVFAACSDAYVALGRVSTFLMAEELGEPFLIDESSKWSVDIEGGQFKWEASKPLDDPTAKKGKRGERGKGKKEDGKSGKKTGSEEEASKSVKRNWLGRKREPKDALPTCSKSKLLDEGKPKTDTAEKTDEEPFELRDINFRVQKGSFVAIVGRVGSGKSSLLQSMIGEMRKTGGEVVLGGTIAYVPQQAWIMNASMRENVLFGQKDDEEKFQEIVEACCLQQDIDMLPDGDATEIGEKGINLSGGQKARVSLARAAYSPSDTILLDDCLSAVDAHVGKAIVDDCLLTGPLSSRTRILVTHALHVLPLVDRIFVVDQGRIVEEGTYSKLMAESDGSTTPRMFKQLIDEYGSLEKAEGAGSADKATPAAVSESGAAPKHSAEAAKKGPGAAQLMMDEERNTGAVTWSTYAQYLRAAGGLSLAPFVLFLLLAGQAAQVGNNIFLGFWTANSLPGFDRAKYMGTYAALGFAQALFAFITSFSFSLAGLHASLMLFKMALNAILRSPVSFFDTTPLGRIVSRLAKDQDTLDTQLSQSAYQVLATFATVLGTVALVFYTFPLLGIIFAPLSILYYIIAKFYRRTSVETKRLDSILRSNLYASYSESLTGLSTIRAYRDQTRFIRDAEDGVDGENRAYYMTVAVQRWLSVRLDFLGNILILGIVLFAVGYRKTVNPSKIGVVLSYTLSITQTFSQMISQYAIMEQNMNAAERVLVYSELPAEGKRTTPEDPNPAWPDIGRIKFSDVSLAYREGLPLVLKGVDFEIKPGEKVGIVGRTGAGKTSLLQALFRIVEIKDGRIDIDGVNIRNIGLDTLRQRLALVPQDPVLFLGTLRENLDPLKTKTDAEIIQALQRAWLLPQNGITDPGSEAKFGLDSQVADEGSNFSAGERQLIALCRALVKGSRIIVLDEASSSVDVETDAKVQKTIQKEFSSSTLLCIAHRLNTIVYYDRILVMDAGRVAEMDTPLNLFDKPGSIFRSLCNEAGLSRQDIERIRSGVQMEEVLEEKQADVSY